MKRYTSILAIGVIIAAVLLFFKPFLLENKLPIPADTIVGLYHPFRDANASEYPNGIPYKNFLITDPVRQQFPWRDLVITEVASLQLPLWNPYNFAGTPLLANIQAATFYPGNILFLFLPFITAWSILILLQPLLAGIFLYIYLRNLAIEKSASLLGAISFSFSGFFVAWFEWGTVLHVALWLPLLLLSIDTFFKKYSSQKEDKRTPLVIWSCIFVFSLACALFAGHIQTFFYLYLIVFVYFFARWVQKGKNTRLLLLFVFLNLIFLVITFLQWYSTLQLILYSARDIDQSEWTKQGWFIPWEHAIQFFVPDFFGNPASLNYWGIWNYAEFIGYVGLAPFIMAIFAIFFRRDKKTLFFSVVLGITILFAFPTFLAKIPYFFSLPFISTTQPTRLLFLIDFSLAVLAAFGFDYFLKNPTKKITFCLLSVGSIFFVLWLLVFFGNGIPTENIIVAKRNMQLPSAIYFFLLLLLVITLFLKRRRYVLITFTCIFVALTIFDLLRFAQKFTPFTNPSYIYPSTKTIEFLQKQKGEFRIMSTDSRVFPPNFSVMYRLQSIEGYDPLYLRRYGEFIAASERKKSDVQPPFGFNRIITPHNYDTKLIDLLNVKYVLSLAEIQSPKLEKVFQEGQTRVYENTQVFPRVFFVESIQNKKTKQDVIDTLFDKNVDLKKTAIIEDPLLSSRQYSKGSAQISRYTANEIVIHTSNKGEGFLVFTDTFYPMWRAKITDRNSNAGRQIDIIQTNYIFRGVVIPAGEHTVTFYTTLL